MADTAIPMKALEGLKNIRVRSKAKAMIDEAAANADAPIKWPTPIQYALDKLTYKQRKFVILMASGLPKNEAYRRSYDVNPDKDERILLSEACHAAANDNVASAKQILLGWLDKFWLLESKEAVEWGLSNLYEDAIGASKASERIAATTAIMKYHGAFVSRSEVRHIHENDPSGTIELLDAIKDVIGLAVPKPLPQIEQARIESVELIDADSTSVNL